MGTVFGPFFCFAVLAWRLLQFFNHHDAEESWLLYFNCLPGFLLLVALPLGAGVGLRCVIFPDYIHLLFC